MTAPERIYVLKGWDALQSLSVAPKFDGHHFAEYIRADLVRAPAEALAVPEVAALLDAARKAVKGLTWAQIHLNEAEMKSLSVDVGLHALDAALRAIGERAE